MLATIKIYIHIKKKKLSTSENYIVPSIRSSIFLWLNKHKQTETIGSEKWNEKCIVCNSSVKSDLYILDSKD